MHEDRLSIGQGGLLFYLLVLRLLARVDRPAEVL